jgi:uncharacterized membrane protein
MAFGIQLVSIFSLVFVSLYLLWVYFFSVVFIPSLQNNDSTKKKINYSDAMKLWLILLVVYIVGAFDHTSGAISYFKLLVLGLAIFGTYLFTNLGVFSAASPQVLIVDMIWGTVVSGLSAFVTSYIINGGIGGGAGASAAPAGDAPAAFWG